MQTLDLECPSCGEMLELDAGFAGGVCRCSSCGTLMTVPKDAGRQAETLSRPTSGYDSAMGIDALPDSATGTSPKRSLSKDKRGKVSRGSAISQTIEPGEYRTASGKVVKLDATVKVPMAESKRKQIRAATAIVFFGIVGLIVVAAGVAIALIVSSGSGVGGANDDGTPRYNERANPYDVPFANIAGLPVLDETAVVVEASTTSTKWRNSLADMLGIGFSRPSEAGRVALFAAQDDEAVYAELGMSPLAEATPEKVMSWFDALPRDKEVDVAAAMKTALASSPDTLVLVIGSAEDAEVAKWKSLASGYGDVTVHAVLIDGSPLALRRWLSDRQGSELVLLSSQDIKNYRFIAETLDE